MATYGQWVRGGKVTRVAWVCGPEQVLQGEVVAAHIRALSGVHPVTLWADDQPVWDELLTSPAGPRFFLVRYAERMGRRDLIPHLLSDEFDGSYVLFTSAEDDFPRDGKQLVSGLAALRDSRHGQLIRCCAPASEEDQFAIVASWWPGAGKNIAAQLLRMCGGDLTRARNAADKAVRVGLLPSVTAIPMVCSAEPAENFADMVMAGDRRGAMNAARAISPEACGGVIGLLASRVAIMPLVREGMQRRESPQDMVRRLKADAWVLRQLRPYAADYDPARTVRCRELLAMAETSWRSGARTGILEAIAALW